MDMPIFAFAHSAYPLTLAVALRDNENIEQTKNETEYDYSIQYFDYTDFMQRSKYLICF